MRYRASLLALGALLAGSIARGQDTPAAGLVGQTVTICGTERIPLEATVEQADVTPTDDGALRIVLVVRTTNRGNAPAGSSFGAHLQDERGRTFEWAGGLSLGEQLALDRQYGVRGAEQSVQPGLSLRTIWPFTVAPDVQTVTIVQSPLWRCS